jgi:hypothetical protein
VKKRGRYRVGEKREGDSRREGIFRRRRQKKEEKVKKSIDPTRSVQAHQTCSDCFWTVTVASTSSLSSNQRTSPSPVRMVGLEAGMDEEETEGAAADFALLSLRACSLALSATWKARVTSWRTWKRGEERRRKRGGKGVGGGVSASTREQGEEEKDTGGGKTLTVPSGRTISVAARTKVGSEMSWMALEEEEGLSALESDLREKMDLKEGIVDRNRLVRVV